MQGVVRRVASALFVLALIAQAVVLYAPNPPSEVPAVPGLDTAVHVAVFMAPALLGVVARLRTPWLGAVLAAHAIASEIAQHLLLAERTGDPRDVAANLVGVALGLVVGRLLRVRLRLQRDGSAHVSVRSYGGRYTDQEGSP